MKEDSLGSIYNLLLDVAKIAASFSIFCGVFGFFYLLIYITILLRDTVFFPVSVQDVFMISRRWGLLALCAVIIIISNKNILLQKLKVNIVYNRKYIIFKYIIKFCQKIYYANIFLACLLFILIYNNTPEYKILLYITCIVIILIFITTLLTENISKMNIVFLLFSVATFSAYYDILKIHTSSSIYTIKDRQNFYYGKIYLHLADGIFLHTKGRIIYLKSSAIQSVSKLN